MSNKQDISHIRKNCKPPTKRLSGFSLVELMVAMFIGLVILLGAGQLFLTTVQNFRTVGHLSAVQGTVQFAADVLVRDFRRAGKVSSDSGCEDDDAVVCFEKLTDRAEREGCASNDDMHRRYKLSERPRGRNGGEGYELMQQHSCNSGSGWSAWEPIVAGLSEGGLDVEPVGNGVYRVRLCLMRMGSNNRVDLSPCNDGEWLSFYAVNRSEAVTE